MKVILTETVEKLGQEGEVKEVANGYARNFLFPRGLAIPATPGAMKQAEARRTHAQRQIARIVTEAEQLAARLNGLEVLLFARTGEQNRLYGSITAADVADAIKAQHKVAVDRRKLSLDNPVHRTGNYTATANLGRNITAKVNVTVESEANREAVLEARRQAAAAAAAAAAPPAEAPAEAPAAEGETTPLEAVAAAAGTAVATVADAAGTVVENVAEAAAPVVQNVADAAGTAVSTVAEAAGGLLRRVTGGDEAAEDTTPEESATVRFTPAPAEDEAPEVDTVPLASAAADTTPAQAVADAPDAEAVPAETTAEALESGALIETPTEADVDEAADTAKEPTGQ